MGYLDDLFLAFANPVCRELVLHLNDRGEHVTTVDDVCKRLASPPERTEYSVRVELHHEHLPKLQAVGFVDYDDRSGVIRVRSVPPVVADLCSLVEEHGERHG